VSIDLLRPGVDAENKNNGVINKTVMRQTQEAKVTKVIRSKINFKMEQEVNENLEKYERKETI